MSTETTGVSTERLALEPLRVEHADVMTAVLGDRSLYEFTGGQPPTYDELVERYGYQVVGPTSSAEVWHNWILRRSDTGDVVGFVQATVEEGSADIAWLIGIHHQGHGYAVEAARAMVTWLEQHGTGRFTAHIHPAHQASAGVATAVGLRRTDQVDEDGEEVWVAEVANRYGAR